MSGNWANATIGDITERTESVNPLLTPDQYFEYVDVSSVSRERMKIEETQTLLGANAPSRARKRVRTGDIIFATIRPTLLRVAMIPKELDNQVCSTGYVVLRPKPVVDVRFLFYRLLNQDFIDRMASLQKGASYPAVTDGDVKSQAFSYPEIREQHRLVGILDKAFAAIAAARQNILNADKRLVHIYESQLSNIFSYPKKNWMSATIAEVATIKSGSSVDTMLEQQQGEIAYIKVSDMNMKGNEVNIINSTRFLKRQDIGKNGIFPIGTTVFPKRGGAILTNKKRITQVPIAADLNVMGVIPSDIIRPEFLHLYFKNVDLRLLGSGSSIPQINNYDIAPLVITYPVLLDEQDAEIKRLHLLEVSTEKAKAAYSSKLTALDEFKRSILAKAFSGELSR